MELFISGEIDGRQGEELPRKFHEVSKCISDKINNYIKDKTYGSEVTVIGITPIIMNFENGMDENEWFKERKLFKSKSREADFRLRINYNEFLKGDKETCELLLIKNIINSIRILGQRAKKDFNATKLEKDILHLFSITTRDII